MLFTLTPISLIIFIAAFVNLFVAYSSWQRRKAKSGIYFAYAMMAVTFWTFCAALDYAAVPLALKVFFAKLEYLGYLSAAAFFAAFALSYAGYEDWLKKAWVKLLLIGIPVSNVLLAWTNDWHGWLWAGFRPNDAVDNVVIFEHGPAFTWVVLSGYVLILIIFVSLFTATRKGPELARKQARLLLWALLALMASNLIYLFDVFDIPGVDWSSILFSITGLLFLFALYGSRFMDIVPIARNTMIERMADGVVVLDVRGNLVDFNPAAQDIFGLKQEDLWTPPQAALTRWPEIIALLKDPARPLSTEITTGDPARVFDLRLTPLQDNRNEVYGLLIVMRDITAHKQADFQREATLAALAQRTYDLGERVKELNCLFGLSALIESSGESIEPLLQGVAALLPPAWQYPAIACARVTLVGQTFSTPNFQPTPWMQQRPILIEGVPEGSVLVGYLEAASTGDEEPFLPQEKRLLEAIAERLGKTVERILARRALRESEERFRTLFEQAAVGVALLETQTGRYVRINQKYCDFLQYTLEEMLERTFQDVTSPEDRAANVDHNALLIEGRIAEFSLEKRYVRKDGRVVWGSLTASPLWKAGEKPAVYYHIAVVEDITERKEAEEEIRRLNATLEQRVAERTRELAEANVQLAELSHLKDNFITRISHELRTPLANAKLYLQLLERGQPDKRAAYLHTLHQQTDRLQHLIEDLLDVSHLTLESIAVDAAPLDVTALLRDLMTDQAAQALERGLTLTVLPTPDRLTLTTDRTLLRQALSNVLTNALSYTPRGGAITLRTDRTTTPDGEWVTIEIRDTGPGILTQDLPRIFEPFYRGAAAADYRTPGTGVGLAITQRQIERLDGRITVESNPGQGTVFTIWLHAD